MFNTDCIFAWFDFILFILLQWIYKACCNGNVVHNLQLTFACSPGSINFASRSSTVQKAQDPHAWHVHSSYMAAQIFHHKTD